MTTSGKPEDTGKQTAGLACRPAANRQLRRQKGRRSRPFCSRRFADIDLGRWFQERYAIPAVEGADGRLSSHGRCRQAARARIAACAYCSSSGKLLFHAGQHAAGSYTDGLCGWADLRGGPACRKLGSSVGRRRLKIRVSVVRSAPGHHLHKENQIICQAHKFFLSA